MPLCKKCRESKEHCFHTTADECTRVMRLAYGYGKCDNPQEHHDFIPEETLEEEVVRLKKEAWEITKQNTVIHNRLTALGKTEST